jgi:hypothetical protein
MPSIFLPGLAPFSGLAFYIVGLFAQIRVSDQAIGVKVKIGTVEV